MRKYVLQIPFFGFSHIEDSVLNKTGYFCPQCNSKYCELPVECKTCGITLVTSAHLVRPLHHLIPIHVFKDVFNSPNSNTQCYGCQKRINDSIEQVCSSQLGSENFKLRPEVPIL